MKVRRIGLILAAAYAARLSAWGEDAVFAWKWAHPRLTVVRLQDRTDRHNELYFETEYLLSRNEAAFDVSAPALFVEDAATGEGRAFLRVAPLPESRPVKGADFRVEAGRGRLLVRDTGYPCVQVAYAGGAVGRVRAATDFQRARRAYVPGRDGLFLSNTWGDGNRDACINEAFLLREVAAGAALGVDVIQIDDGWQKGRSANSAKLKKGEKGSWSAFWHDPEFWTPDPERFPRGLEPVVGAARAQGLKFGLWYGPDSSNEAARWEKDLDLLLGLHRRFGIDYFKLDSIRSESPRTLQRQQKLMDGLLAGSGGRITVDLDVTAQIRPGYFGFPEVGPVFVENRYIRKGESRLWWPHLTLRNLWSLAHVVDPARLRMEVLNPDRLPDAYPAGDPLAPAQWPKDALFASVMFASPLGWFEIQNLSPETVAAWKPLIATWKRHRDAVHAGYIHPVGGRPDGFAWTGFVSTAKDGRSGTALLFRERSAKTSFALDLSPYLKAERVEVLAGRGTAALAGNVLTVDVPAPLDFIWVRLGE